MTPAQFALLLALSQDERHGWGLIKDVEELTGGRIQLGPGTLYRTLQRLRVDGMIEEVGVDPAAVRADRRAERQRRYRITPAGRAAVTAEARFLAGMLDRPPARRLLEEEG
ncbi:PadR family transcriptional regulator [Microlunatus parietis]|uniref:DNA-binding PadR family transcriptional regulator n=1 Tax=Microlunatus parietis TaxID=682979 RepID=A0A7Y9LD14_9ACTN|nr:helix-turn-helix transcriptional regulator [Microlunatus parietis]NYE71476.1 DNA-binding PadR family transcriptional regulator [Microlunatus parietis]